MGQAWAKLLAAQHVVPSLQASPVAIRSLFTSAWTEPSSVSSSSSYISFRSFTRLPGTKPKNSRRAFTWATSDIAPGGQVQKYK
jgi:hypothetical protein